MSRADRVILARQLLDSFKPLISPTEILVQHGIATLALYDYFTMDRVNYDTVMKSLASRPTVRIDNKPCRDNAMIQPFIPAYPHGMDYVSHNIIRVLIVFTL